MTRPDHIHRWPTPTYSSLAKRSESLACSLDIDVTRVHTCLERTEEGFRKDVNSQLNPMNQAESLIHEVFSSLPECDGFQVMETGDPRQLRHRIRTVEYLTGEYVPFSTLEELSDQLSRFLEFQYDIEPFLIRTGLPPRTFEESPWLFLHLGRLYDTRCTSSPYPETSLPTFEEGQSPIDVKPHPPGDPYIGPPRPRIQWQWEKPREPSQAKQLLPSCPREPYAWVKYANESVIHPSEVTHCEFDQANYLFGLKSEDAEKLQANRGAILAARKAILGEVISAIDRKKGKGLLERCLKVLCDQLEITTIHFLLCMDSFYLQRDFRESEEVNVTPKISPGGLTNLVEVVSHVETELKIGQFDDFKRSIADSSLSAISEADEPVACYLQVIVTSEADKINAALDRFNANIELAQDQRKDVCNRFSHWVRSEIQGLPTLGQPVASQGQDDAILEDNHEYLSSQSEPSEKQAPEPQASARNQFVFQKNKWTITFEGKNIVMPPLDGFLYISRLLQQPEVVVSPLELRRLITEWKTNDPRQDRMKEQIVIAKADSENRSVDDLHLVQRDAGLAMDPLGLVKARLQLPAIDERIASAVAEGRAEDAAELRDERKKLQNYIDSTTDHNGAPKSLKSTLKNASDSVRKAVDTAKKNLNDSHPQLLAHFDQYLMTGAQCRYSPPEPIDWDC